MVEQTGFSASGEAHGKSGVLMTSSFFSPPNQCGCEHRFSLWNSNISQKGASAPPAGFCVKYLPTLNSACAYSESLLVC